jgi:TetR/AcrR family transcriptional repressor of nem operon
MTTAIEISRTVRKEARGDTRAQIVQHAERLIQERGHNGFSYRDLAELLGIKTSSIHYHFPQKEDLLLAVVQDYQTAWHAHIAGIAPTLSARDKLLRYCAQFETNFAGSERVCLGGSMAADVSSVPDDVRQAIQAFYRANENWIAQVLEAGRQDGTLPGGEDTAGRARALFATLQGSLLGARLFKMPARLQNLMPALYERDGETKESGA